VRFGETIELLGVTPGAEGLTLVWRTDQPIAHDYTVFVHLLDAAGEVAGQLDGTPFGNRYPTSAWQPGQVIVDTRQLADAGVDMSAVARVAIGLYDPVSGARLAATDEDGTRLLDDALVVEWE
jgi:hypothetical protein